MSTSLLIITNQTFFGDWPRKGFAGSPAVSGLRNRQIFEEGATGRGEFSIFKIPCRLKEFLGKFF